MEHLNLWNANRLFIDLRHPFSKIFCSILLLAFNLVFSKKLPDIYILWFLKFNIYTYQPRWSRYQSFLQNISSRDSVVDSCRSFSSWTSDSITTVMYKIQYISVIPNLTVTQFLKYCTIQQDYCTCSQWFMVLKVYAANTYQGLSCCAQALLFVTTTTLTYSLWNVPWHMTHPVCILKSHIFVHNYNYHTHFKTVWDEVRNVYNNDKLFFHSQYPLLFRKNMIPKGST